MNYGGGVSRGSFAEVVVSQNSAEKESLTGSRGWWRIATVVGIGFIALGNASDATLLIRELGVEIYTRFSNDYEYQTLASIHVGNTVAYIEDRLGQPQVSRAIDDETTANYFHGGDYLLTLFYNSNRIEAFTWLSLDDDFAPDVDLLNGEVRPLGEFTFSDLPLEVSDYTLDDSPIVRFYIESLEEGRSGGILGTYFGNIQHGAFESAGAVPDLYRAEVMGDNAAANSARAQVRKETIPNLYGRGNLPLDRIEKSVLSNSEFAGYFGAN